MATETITLRPERPSDRAEVGVFVKTAFETAKVSSGTEQDFVDTLRASPGWLPGLALVAVEGERERIVGHVVSTRKTIDTTTGPREVLLLAPLAVALDHRGRGLGARLTRAVLDAARADGFDAVLLVGDPAYYGRFGFRTSTDFGISNTAGIPDLYVLMTELVPGALAGLTGTVDF